MYGIFTFFWLIFTHSIQVWFIFTCIYHTKSTIHVPTSSKWPFDSPNGGHSSREKLTKMRSIFFRDHDLKKLVYDHICPNGMIFHQPRVDVVPWNFPTKKGGGLHVSETLPFGSPKSSNLVKWNNISPSFGFPWNKEISLPYVPLGRCGDPMGLISGLSAIDTVESFNPRFPRDLGKQRRFPGCFWWMWML